MTRRASAPVWCVPSCEDHDGSLWMGTLSAGINRFDSHREQWTVYRRQWGNTNSLLSNWVRAGTTL